MSEKKEHEFTEEELKNIEKRKRNAMWKVEMLRNTYFNKKDIQGSGLLFLE